MELFKNQIRFDVTGPWGSSWVNQLGGILTALGFAVRFLDTGSDQYAMLIVGDGDSRDWIGTDWKHLYWELHLEALTKLGVDVRLVSEDREGYRFELSMDEASRPKENWRALVQKAKDLMQAAQAEYDKAMSEVPEPDAPVHKHAGSPAHPFPETSDDSSSQSCLASVGSVKGGTL